jgi:hypothetical protein
MNDIKVWTHDAISFQSFDWMEWWKHRSITPNIVTLMYGTDYAMAAAAATTTSTTTKSLLYHFDWPHTWTDDIATSRTPLLVFEFIYNSNRFTHHQQQQLPQPPPSAWYGLYGISVLFWIELVTIQLAVCLLAALPISIFMYYIIILPQKKVKQSVSTTRKQMKQSTMLGYMIGWFLFIPIWIFVPSPMATYFGITNAILRFFVCGTTPTIAIFRTLEAMYGFAPSHTITSVYNYALYFTSPLLLNPKTETNIHKTNVPRMKQFTSLLYHQTTTFVTGLFITGLYQSYIREFVPYGNGPASTPSNLYMWSSLLDLQIWYQTISYAFLLQLYLSTCSAGLALSTMVLTGYTTQPISDAPLQHCTSPSNFWGRRWNNLIHTCLKNGVFRSDPSDYMVDIRLWPSLPPSSHRVCSTNGYYDLP